MQKTRTDDIGRCIVLYAPATELVVVFTNVTKNDAIYMIHLKLVWITNHVGKHTMGTGFETWAAFHTVEGSNFNANYTKTRAVSKHAFFF